MKKHLDKFITLLIEWVFRRRSPALTIIRIGASTLIAVFGVGFAFNLSFPFQHGEAKLVFDTSQGTLPALTYMGGFAGLVCLLVGLGLLILECRGLLKKKVIVIEVRGLRDTSGTPLIGALPKDWLLQRTQILLDIRQRVQDGFIINPQEALNRLNGLSYDLKRHEDGLDREDIKYVYGGLAPVPLTFLTGVLMDDEGMVEVWDWNRHEEGWRPLNGNDDGKRFAISGLVDATDAEVALAVSGSYDVDLVGVKQKLGKVPLVHMKLEDGGVDAHWSEGKQIALGQQFLSTVIQLYNNGVKRIHLFIAAQNSIVFRFGRLYDKRNLPEVIVYQYQREQSPPFPWGVKMPVSGVIKSEII